MSDLLTYAKERREHLRAELKRLDTFIELGDRFASERDRGVRPESPFRTSEPRPMSNGAGSSGPVPLPLKNGTTGSAN